MKKSADILSKYFQDLDFRNIAKVKISGSSQYTDINISGQNTEKLLFTRASEPQETRTVFIPHIANE